MRLPDPRRSYAVLIGSGTYASARLPNLPAVAGNLTGLARALTDPALGAFPPDRCIVVPDPADSAAACRTLREYAARAEDTLLVYWAGHALPGPRDELYLGVSGTDAAELPASALAIGRVREAMLRSPAANRILLLDSCVGGRAEPVSDVAAALPGQLTTEGADILVSAPRDSLSLFPPGNAFTAFTGALIGLMRNGVPDGPEFLTLATIYSELLYVLASRCLPRPRQFGTGAAGQLALGRNPAYDRSRQRVAPRPARDRPSSRAARWRTPLAAVAVVFALGACVSLAGVTGPAGSVRVSSINPAFLETADQISSFPATFNVGVSPAAVLSPATRSRAISLIISRLDRQLAARHFGGRKIALVQLLTPATISGIAPSERAARLVLDSVPQRDPIFASAASQSFWIGSGDYFIFHIYFSA